MRDNKIHQRYYGKKQEEVYGIKKHFFSPQIVLMLIFHPLVYSSP